MMKEQNAQQSSISELASDLATKALAEASTPAAAVSALLGAASEILSLTFAPEVACGIIVQGCAVALAQHGSLMTAIPVGRA